jgi:Protein of unknown function (DUF3180)
VQMTRPGTLAGVFVICAIAAWIAVRETFASLPLFPISTIPVLLALALGETFVARYVRNRLAGRGSAKPFAPIAVARLVALAKASSAAASVIGGLSAGFLIYVLGSLDKTIPARDARVAGITVACAVALVAAALYLERCCRAPKPPDDKDDDDKSYFDTWSWHK